MRADLLIAIKAEHDARRDQLWDLQQSAMARIMWLRHAISAEERKQGVQRAAGDVSVMPRISAIPN